MSFREQWIVIILKNYIICSFITSFFPSIISRKYLRSILDVPKNEKITRSMLKYGRKNFTNECTEKSWIEIMNRDDELPPYDFALYIIIIYFVNFCNYKFLEQAGAGVVASLGLAKSRAQIEFFFGPNHNNNST